MSFHLFMTHMEQLDLSSNPYHKRQFIFWSLVAFIALMGLRFFILPVLFKWPLADMQDIVNAVLEGFIVALVSSVAITFLLLWLNPSAKEQLQIKVLNPGKELKDFLNQDLSGTHEFWYRGHTAKWTRSVTLPKLAIEARATRLKPHIYIIILNPNNKQALNLLAEWDHERNPKLSLETQLKFIKKQLIATILSVLDSRMKEPLLHIELALHNNFSLFRVDLSSKSAIITRSGPRESAIRFSAASDFYRSFQSDLQESFSQSRRLPMEKVLGFNLADLQVGKAREILQIFGIDLKSPDHPELDLDDQALTEIIDIAREPKNPYPD